MNKTYDSAIIWFRRDLRLRANPALDFAIKNAKKLTFIYIYAPEEEKPWEMGGASKWWLHHSLSALAKDIKSRGGHLNIFSSNSLDTINETIKNVDADLVVWNRLYEPEIIQRDKNIKAQIEAKETSVKTFNSSLLIEPWKIKNSTNGPYQVFSPYWRKLKSEYIDVKITNAPKVIQSKKLSASIKIEDLDLLPKISWDKNFYRSWTVGEVASQKKLKSFFKTKLSDYKIDRDFPSKDGSSTLSAPLHFGEISPHDIWNKACELEVSAEITEPFLRQLGWRDFAHHLLFHFPETPQEPLKKDFKRFPWNKDKKLLSKWQKGLTGFPIVDAGMRELWQTGIMHNRVRMIVGSILVKNFLIHWNEGANWFWKTLIDADLANNTLGWQWIAGCGADAAPYFRIFNPVTQSERFDKEGLYIRKWIPELSNIPDKWIHKPWDCPEKVLTEAKVILGKDYPLPCIDLKASREEALSAYYSLKS